MTRLLHSFLQFIEVSLSSVGEFIGGERHNRLLLHFQVALVLLMRSAAPHG